MTLRFQRLIIILITFVMLLSAVLLIATSTTAVHKNLKSKKDQPGNVSRKMCRLFNNEDFMSQLGLC